MTTSTTIVRPAPVAITFTVVPPPPPVDRAARKMADEAAVREVMRAVTCWEYSR